VTTDRSIYLGLGSNLDDRLAQLRIGLSRLAAAGVAIETVSSVYETEPWGEQPPGTIEIPRYANAVVCLRSGLASSELLRLCKLIEVAAGRDLSAPRNSPRPIDLDLLLVGGEQSVSVELELPHPRMHERAFVLIPLAEIAPDLFHPRLQRTIEALRSDISDEGVELLDGVGWDLI
jgi:2-amino-4-hydroxy-6-hydroxymethyldihydropteridine diphosphokinase